ncbi:hypothetical protein C0966_00580 [Bacillus methanolicus]|uniref:exodeoxyribonuclease X C-terminal domain-containing protein n=1 Tax=Bacillus methanolicus TaxID=1471 RepID=UPI0023808D45|nr:hypothetical protein [Bacillus methanolicus]MDE3837904.1 hypothetical protein [Bacillus methanolicus]
MGEPALQQQNTALSLIDSVDINSVQSTLTKISQFQMVVQNTLKPNFDFGVIPGTPKPTLFKPGAEKILMMFGVTSEYEVVERVQDYQKGFFAFTVKCLIFKNGTKITEGVGHCNTKEKKYINQDPFTLANTCLKMAKKRAQIDATLTLASLSEVFTQDIEDMHEYMQTEQIETMTAQDAAQIKITFGKHKGKTLKEIYKTQPDYLEWLVKQDRTDPVIKKGIELMFQAVKQQNTKKKDEDPKEEAPLTDNQDVEMFSGEDIEIKDEDLPFNL